MSPLDVAPDVLDAHIPEVRDNLSPFQQQLRRNARESMTRLGAIYAANVWIVLPAVIALAIMAIFGEGPYVVPVMGLLWTGCIFIGLHIRRTAEPGSSRHFQGLWVCVWSSLLAIMMLALTVADFLDGTLAL